MSEVKNLDNGDKYEGEMKNGKMQGKGIYTFSNGERYEGEFKDDMFEGKGTYYYPDGTKKTGVFQKDELIKMATEDWIPPSVIKKVEEIISCNDNNSRLKIISEISDDEIEVPEAVEWVFEELKKADTKIYFSLYSKWKLWELQLYAKTYLLYSLLSTVAIICFGYMMQAGEGLIKIAGFMLVITFFIAGKTIYLAIKYLLLKRKTK